MTTFGPMTLSRVVLFVVAFIALDAISYVHGFHGLPISPWNPNSGLAVAMLLRHGIAFAPVVAGAAIVADQLVREVPLTVSIPTEIVSAALYTAATTLLRHWLRVVPPVDKPRALTAFFVTMALAALVTTGARIALAVHLPHFETDWVAAMFLRQWVGDLIGICLFAPLFLHLGGDTFRDLKQGWPLEREGQFAVTLLMAVVVFGLEATDEFQFFYLLFLPVIWLALRGGITTTLAAMALIQVVMMAATYLRDMDDGRVTALQFLMLTLVLTGSLMAATAQARRRAELAIRTRMDELARMSRIHTSNEIATGMAHELKQPMLAIVNYVGAARRLLERDPSQVDEALRLMHNTDTQVMRADSIIRRMRDFTRKSEFLVEAVDLGRTLRDAVEMTEPLARRHGVDVVLVLGDDLPVIMADGVQVLQVAVNLLTNAIHAIAEDDSRERHIRVETCRHDGENIRLTVSDSGPGLDPDRAQHIFEPFVTTRAQGMGVGLAISRAIAEHHGGALWHDPPQPGHGAVFHVRLPIEARHEHS